MALGALSTLVSSPAAIAAKMVELRDGTKVEVFEHGLSITIVALRGSVPSQWILDFKSALGKYAGFALGQRSQISEIFKELSDPGAKNSAGVADVVTLGDTWLGVAVQRGLVQPIPNADNSRWWHLLSPRWHALIRRNAAGLLDPSGNVYGAPYRWGATLVAYRPDKLLRWGGKPIRDWEDLLQPQLRGRIAFVDSSRELLAVALRTLGLSANTRAADLPTPSGITTDDVRRRIGELKAQARLYSSRDHIRALGAGDVWATVGWSTDLVAVGERSNSVELVAPASGTLLFADLWVVPAGAEGGNLKKGPSPLLPSWLEFGLSPMRAATHNGLKSGATPLLLPEPQPFGRQISTHGEISAMRHHHVHGRTSHQKDSSSKSGQPASFGPAHSVEILSPDSAPLDRSSSAVVLEHANRYMPSEQVLRHSEFLLPLDAESLQLYGDLLLHTAPVPPPAAPTPTGSSSQ